MPDLRDLKFIKQERHETARPQIEHAIIARTPDTYDDPIPIVLPEFDNAITWGPCAWTSHNGDMPQEGDDCLVVFSNRREPWIIAWWPGQDDQGFATEAWVMAQNFATQAWVNAQGFATQAWVTALGYATQSYVNSAIAANGPHITSGPLSAGPPGAPVNGDIWIALAAGANGENWQFRYNSGSASAYKWEFIGGSKVELFRSTADPYTSNSTWINDSNLGSITILRAGEYIIAAAGNAGASSSGAQTITSGLWYNGAISGGDLGGMAAAAASYRIQFAWELPAGVAAGSTVGLAMWDNSASAFTMLARSLSILPRRIS